MTSSTAINWRRVRAIFRKELREFRRNPNVIAAMAIYPVVFTIPPVIDIFVTSAAQAITLNHFPIMIYMLAIPAIVPAAVAAFSIVGEREQGTLEPMLGTPIRSTEFLLGKALATLVPAVTLAYVGYGVILGCVELFTTQPVTAAAVHGPDVLAQFLFTPLLACWSIWLCFAVSSRAKDVRVAQQLGVLVNVPSIAVPALIAYGVFRPDLAATLAIGALLLAGDVLGWRVISRTLSSEWLVIGHRAAA
jgi:ABC-type transport system involved in multi-copper enzyme maturation permease subunit